MTSFRQIEANRRNARSLASGLPDPVHPAVSRSPQTMGQTKIAVRPARRAGQLRKRLVDMGFSDDFAVSRLKYSGPPIHARIAGSKRCYGSFR